MEEEKNQVKQLAIVSGKGGTGKTTIAAAFAALANGVQEIVHRMWEEINNILKV